MDLDNHWIEVELEENAWGTLVIIQFASVVCDTVLVCVKRRGARRHVGSRDYMKIILVRHERCQQGKLPARTS